MKLLTSIAAVTLLFIAPLANALEAANPGKSLWGVSLGSSRVSATAVVSKRFGKSARHESHKFSRGLVDDIWIIPNGDESLRFEILSVRGKITQLRAWNSSGPGPTNLSFAQLLKRHALQKRVYGFEDPQGGGYVGFYYDDVKRGVCFTAGVQDDFILTSRPDGIIIHRAGAPIIAIADGVRGTVVTGRGARAYASEDEARRIEQREQNDY